MSSTSPRVESGISTSPVVADSTTLMPSVKRSLPPETEPMVDNSTWSIDLRTPSLPPSDTGRGWSLFATTEGQRTGINQRSPTPPPRILTPSQPLTMSPECIMPEQSTHQQPNPPPTSKPSTKPDPTNPNPLYLLAEAAELSSLAQEDLAAASILLQLHRQDALLANSYPDKEAKTTSPDTDSDATIPDDTPYQRMVVDGGGQRKEKQNQNQNQQQHQRPPGSSPFSSSPAKEAAARRGGKRKRGMDVEGSR